MAKVQKITGSQTLKNWKWQKSASGAMFRARNQHATGTYRGKSRRGMKILKAYNNSPLVTMSQKGSENTITSM